MDSSFLPDWTPNDQIYNILIVDEREKKNELVQQQMETCKQNHIKLKPARNENQPPRVQN